MHRLLFPLAFLLVFMSCSKEKETPVSGTITLSSELFMSEQYYPRGYSFSEASFFNFLGTAASRIDLLAFSIHNLDGSVSGAGLTCPSNEDTAFWCAGSFDNLSDAELFFRNLDTVPVVTFVPLVGQISPNEIWVIHTGSGCFAKILVRQVRIIEDEEGDYAEVDLDWAFQPDKSRVF